MGEGMGQCQVQFWGGIPIIPESTAARLLALLLASTSGEPLAELQAACDVGKVSACSSLGTLYREGIDVAVDECRAATLFEKSCTGGGAEGCVGLALMYEDGLCVEHDGGRAIALYQKACSGGAGMGCKSLGDLYQAGEGVARNPERALAYLRKACELGVSSACNEIPFEVQLGLRGEADVLLGAAALAITTELSKGRFSGVATAFLKLPLAVRLEGRLYPLQWGVFRPYASLGSTLQFPSTFSAAFAARAAAGADFQFGHVHLFSDVAYEHYFFLPAPEYVSDYLLLALGMGWSF